MASVIRRAQPALDFIPPNYSPLMRRAMGPLMPLWTNWQTNLVEVESRNVEALAKLYHEFELGKTRFLLAFRHPNPTDPYVLSHLLWRDLPQTARQMGLSLGTTHSHFIYDRGIPLWAGGYLSWLFSRLGGVPIQRGKLDLQALKTARDLFANGQFPLAAAPEGGNNGHNEIVSPLEPGIAQLAFWCQEDLIAQERDANVVILPLGIQYRYIEAPWQELESMMTRLEAESGLDTESGLDLYGRLYQLASHLLTLMEGYYQKFYGVTFKAADELAGRTDEPMDANDLLAVRLRSLIDEALKVAEQYFRLRPKGSTIDRCRKLEQAGWDRIFRDDTEKLSPVDRGLADRVAEEADFRLWHMRLVESFVAVTGHYVKENPSADRFAETALLLRDMVEKIKNDQHRQPVTGLQLGPQRAIATVGEPIAIGPLFADYKAKRRQAIASLTKDLQEQMESLILT
ncbi:1-acyl-sn-glycerol-3-phosphate acyltransferase [cf. Phormidesmis sp. LEGE 11477]|uniref:1-acyl-sn-glycerol-3-phosphate acyltransferase n=1 Tax=cf. Phormidesmis sp. LEGE 11477 TaxID=1828680 RepID=UPI0018812D84|nr:1-acyl-sn-glycerol-3-phosphate acyltransferase [cf. Phormidesmis sp. LEGE 11477]MBE9061126.1 1-acyl-sn-glycerol-3-phosphate acyltransferase [cf. Phormidesmis sp. LEGE 11477]